MHHRNENDFNLAINSCKCDYTFSFDQRIERDYPMKENVIIFSRIPEAKRCRDLDRTRDPILRSFGLKFNGISCISDQSRNLYSHLSLCSHLINDDKDGLPGYQGFEKFTI